MTDYKMIIEQAKGLMETDNWYVPLMSNISALIYDSLEDLNWAGFYIVKNDELVLGPFQGKVACIHIKRGKGVCGTAFDTDKTQLVANVHEFPGHIACDSASNSEIVGRQLGDLKIKSNPFNLEKLFLPKENSIEYDVILSIISLGISSISL